MDIQSKLLKTFQTGFDIGNTFYQNLYSETNMLINCRHEDLRLLAPKYFIDILQEDLCRKHNVASVDPDGMFQFMGITMMPGPYEKIVLYHVDYPLYKSQDLIYEFDLSMFS